MTRKKYTALPKTAIRFQNDFLDFQKGIRVGHLEDNQRITRILKLALEARYQEEFITERFGRGSYWHWIGFVSRSNRAAKPISSKISFGCSKFFLTIDHDKSENEQLFKCGFSVERGMLIPPKQFSKAQLQDDWDWHRLLTGLRQKSPLEKELKRLVLHEGFFIDMGNWNKQCKVTRKRFPSMAELNNVLTKALPDEWAGFQVYYPMSEKEIRNTTGVDLIESMMAIFGETTSAMNLCMQISLKQ